MNNYIQNNRYSFAQIFFGDVFFGVFFSSDAFFTAFPQRLTDRSEEDISGEKSCTAGVYAYGKYRLLKFPYDSKRSSF